MPIVTYPNHDAFEAATGTYVPRATRTPQTIVGAEQEMSDWGWYFEGLGPFEHPDHPDLTRGRWIVGFIYDTADRDNDDPTGSLIAFEHIDTKDVRDCRVVVIRDHWTKTLEDEHSGNFRQREHTLEDIDAALP